MIYSLWPSSITDTERIFQFGPVILDIITFNQINMMPKSASLYYHGALRRYNGWKVFYAPLSVITCRTNNDWYLVVITFNYIIAQCNTWRKFYSKAYANSSISFSSPIKSYAYYQCCVLKFIELSEFTPNHHSSS